MKTLHLAKDLKLPLDAVTQTFCILAMRGVGKTHTASVFAEEMSEAGLPFVVLDPTGAWWGLRAGADGKGPGYPVTILGGDHGDVPLEEGAGKLIADLVAEKAPSLILDLSLLSKSAMRRFVADFAEELYRKNRQPLHLLIDEADSFAPQRPRPDEMRMLGALDEIVRRGRIRGLGCTLVTQRSAVLNKDVLTQTECLVVLRTAHPRDRAPVLEWMKVHATPEQLLEVEESLAKLPKGDAWVMSAGWLDLFARVHIRERRTFNSSATPTPGQARVAARLAPVDLEQLGAAMKETAERAKASDPAALRRRVVELERELAKKPAAAAPAPAKERRIEVPVLKDAQVARVEKVVAQALLGIDKLQRLADGLRQDLARAARPGAYPLAATNHKAPLLLDREAFLRPEAGTIAQAPAPRRAAAPRPESNGAPAPAVLRVLQAAAEMHPAPVSRKQLATLTGYRPQGGRFNNILGELRSRGLVDGRGEIRVTEAGLAGVDPETLRPKSGAELQELWRGRLPPAEWRVLQVAIEAYPRALTRDELAAATEYEAAGGRFNNILGSLRAAALLEGRGEIRASEALFG